jgi:flavin reductase (DIM6/NTAB) family NADH-FMN oxidoreductase RutF
MEYTDVPYTSYFKETIAALDQPGCLLVTQDHDGSLNAMVIGWGTIGTIWSKPIFIVLVRPSRFTYQLLEEGSAFTVCVPTPEMRSIVDFCGGKSGRSHDKFRELSLKTVPSTQISVPGIAGSAIIYECQPVHVNDLVPQALTAEIQERFYPRDDFHRVYFGEIQAVRAAVGYVGHAAGQAGAGSSQADPSEQA